MLKFPIVLKGKTMRDTGHVHNKWLLSSGYQDKVPWTEWLLNDRNVFLPVLKAGGLSGCQCGWVLRKALFQVAVSFSSHISHDAREPVRFWGFLFHSWRCCSHDLITSQRPLPPNNITLAFRILTMNFVGWRNGCKHSVHNKLWFCNRFACIW